MIIFGSQSSSGVTNLLMNFSVSDTISWFLWSKS